MPLPLQDACIVYVCNERGALWYGEKRAPDDGCGGNVDGVVDTRRVASHGKPGCVVCPHEAGGTRPRLGIGQCIVDRIAVGVKQAEVDDSGLLLLLLLFARSHVIVVVFFVFFFRLRVLWHRRLGKSLECFFEWFIRTSRESFDCDITIMIQVRRVLHVVH